MRSAQNHDQDRLRLLESAVVHARDAIIVLEATPSATGRSVLYVNDAFTRMTGYTSEEVVGRSLHVLRGPKSDPVTLERLRVALAEGHPLQVELLNYRKDNSELWVELSLVPVPHPEGGLSHWVMIQRDISDRKQAEEKLRRSEELFRGVFENAAAGVSVTDAAGNFVAVNPAFAAMVGRQTEEIIGRSPEAFTHPDDWMLQEPLLQEVAAGMRDQLQLQKRYIRPDGEEVWTELSLAFLRDADGSVQSGLGVSVDISPRKRLEEQLRQAQKMEAIGQMAGGIAHDFNNLLTAILCNLEMVRFNAFDKNRDLIATAMQAAQRAAELTKKLLGFARKNQLVVSSVRVGDFVGEVVHLLRRTFDPRITIVTELDSEDPIWADPTLINLVLMNLCLNARDAMPNGGRLTIRTESVDLADDAPLRNPDARPGHFVRLTIRDTGTGMTPEVLTRLFEPFFTTKPTGQGTGLGLAMVDGIVRQHHGWLEVDSALGAGTRFDVYLPRHLDPKTPPQHSSGIVPRAATYAATVSAADIDDTPPPRERRRVLLVDDEEMIRELGRAILEGAGFQVLEAHDGAEAVDVFRREHAHIDLVVLDLTMPRLSGRDAFRAMTDISPDARVLFSSGYSADDLSDVTGAIGLLPKPYRPRELVDAVERALAGSPPVPAAPVA